MPTSSRFAVAVHVLVSLARADGRPLRSEELANSVDTHPSVIRRLLMSLAQAGITGAQLGAGGGALLVRPAGEVTLHDVYAAVEAAALVALHRVAPNERCPVGAHILPALRAVAARAEAAFAAELAAVTVADVVAAVDARGRRAPPAAAPPAKRRRPRRG